MHYACERMKSNQKQNQVTSHSNGPRVLLFNLVHKQCNGIIKGWLHCLASESIRRFLVNNVLMFDSARCLVNAQIQFSFIKKIRTGLPEHSLPPATSDNISFLSTAPPPHPLPLKWTSYVYHLRGENNITRYSIL